MCEYDGIDNFISMEAKKSIVRIYFLLCRELPNEFSVTATTYNSGTITPQLGPKNVPNLDVIIRKVFHWTKSTQTLSKRISQEDLIR